MKKNVAIIAFWKWEFENEKDEDRENECDDSIDYFHIKSINDIPKGIEFSRVIVASESEDIFSWLELENIIQSVKRNK